MLIFRSFYPQPCTSPLLDIGFIFLSATKLQEPSHLRVPVQLTSPSPLLNVDLFICKHAASPLLDVNLFICNHAAGAKPAKGPSAAATSRAQDAAKGKEKKQKAGEADVPEGRVAEAELSEEALQEQQGQQVRMV